MPTPVDLKAAKKLHIRREFEQLLKNVPLEAYAESDEEKGEATITIQRKKNQLMTPARNVVSIWGGACDLAWQRMMQREEERELARSRRQYA